MEKENRKVIENIEQKGNNTEEKEQPDKKNDNTKKILLITLGIILALCLGIFIFIRINTTEKHVYEEVGNLGEREGVCFDNLLLSSMIYIYNNGEEELKYLCIFNTGDIYCFTWSGLTPWHWYYEGHKEQDYKVGYDETVWEKMYNVIYLGSLSNWDTFCLNQYIQTIDSEGEYYNKREEDPYYFYDLHSNENNRQIEKEEVQIEGDYRVQVYQHGNSGESMGWYVIIEDCHIDYLDINTFEKGELWYKLYDENAIAALDLFESSGFYDRWVAMCLNNE